MIDEIGQEWDVSADSLRHVVLDGRYLRAKQAFSEGRYADATAELENLQRRFPEANLLYKMFYRVFKVSGKP